MKISISFLFCLGVLLCCSCGKYQKALITSEQLSIDLERLKPIIKERGTTWGKALTTKNIDLLKALYDDQAHYLPNDSQAFHGKVAIINYWEESFAFLGDLQLNMESLEGTNGLLYETGNGTVKVMGQDGNFFDMPFKYVNIWKQQKDGSWKVVVDTFNNLSNE